LVSGGLISLAKYMGFWLRFDGSIPSTDAQDGLRLLPLLVAIYGFIFIPFGLFRGLWRYTSIWDLRDLVGAVMIGTFIFFGLVHLWLDLVSYPRSIIILTGILSLSLIGGIRLARR